MGSTVIPPSESINHTKKLFWPISEKDSLMTESVNTLHATEQFNQYNYLARITKSTI